MGKKRVQISFRNGLTFPSFKGDVFDIEGLSELYDFVESENPDIVVFGPYGNDLPPKGKYTRVGYFCENIKPDMDICEWAFGVPHEKEINSPRYKRIQWHGLDPKLLVKSQITCEDEFLSKKTKFCNFIYSHQVPYREEFFKQLSKYKRVDAPGRSMNNMPSIDSSNKGDKWLAKKRFLSEYKFTIAFENDIFPGYQTEKLYDAMQAQSIPIYCGDPNVNEIFNTKSFLNINDYIPSANNRFIKKMETAGLMDFEDIRPAFLTRPRHRAKRKMKSWFRMIKMHLKFANMDFSPVIDKIMELDNNPGLYMQMASEPWYNNNIIPDGSSAKSQWIKIFEGI